MTDQNKTADLIPTTAGSGSYQIPDDILEELGDGDRVAGARLVRKMVGRNVAIYGSDGEEVLTDEQP